MCEVININKPLILSSISSTSNNNIYNTQKQQITNNILGELHRQREKRRPLLASPSSLLLSSSTSHNNRNDNTNLRYKRLPSGGNFINGWIYQSEGVNVVDFARDNLPNAVWSKDVRYLDNWISLRVSKLNISKLILSIFHFIEINIALFIIIKDYSMENGTKRCGKWLFYVGNTPETSHIKDECFLKVAKAISEHKLGFSIKVNNSCPFIIIYTYDFLDKNDVLRVGLSILNDVFPYREGDKKILKSYINQIYLHLMNN